MKKLTCFAAALSMAGLYAADASALPAAQAQIANAAHSAVNVRYHRRHHGASAYARWCSYNCHAVSPSARGPFGAYQYSRYLYDEDIPAHYRYDWDASPTDNGLAMAYPITGEPFLRLFERSY